jgi:crotonobetainyl-CoA:carnitine CoA-transferase CaiB-like acyl-CoA transferase
VATDQQWDALRTELGDPPWARAPELATAAGRLAAQDLIDKELGTWTAGEVDGELADRLARAGIPAAAVITARDVVHNVQVRHRGLFERGRHPVTGEHELPGLPFRFRSVPSWVRGPAPTIGQHNDEVLREVGLTGVEIDRLRSDGVIGDRPIGA